MNVRDHSLKSIMFIINSTWIARAISTSSYSIDVCSIGKIQTRVLELEKHRIHGLQVRTDQWLELHLIEHLSLDVDTRGDLN